MQSQKIKWLQALPIQYTRNDYCEIYQVSVGLCNILKICILTKK